ncbi:dihydropteroate synthase [Pelagibacterium xiamenense]|uniref:dihydropteroate synthase n=1 Tax=Pelagibacterium xiamenense TaxID=2901140 RepID=UPI001E366F22|nr:dihydropteroate synthase [Pelagibacterium xiamenense]MCD7061195.1 dihydropteroate synthase [Pelagibacterium xiamenense]
MIHRPFEVPMGAQTLHLGPTPLVMGILNVTPDSFSDGGDFVDIEAAVSHARHLVAEGADIVDIGGESTRPGSEEVSVQEELDRVMPVLDALAAASIDRPVSIDTYKALVADQAIQAGATMVNDVWGLQRDPEIADVAAQYGVPVVAMHWDTGRDREADIISEMTRWFTRSIEIALGAGVAPNKIVLDPGFGFGKTFKENYILLNRLHELHALGFPLLIGTSRKSMLGKLLDVPPKERVAATVATSVIAYQQGGHIFRVHDIRENRDGLRVAQATLYGPPAGAED